MFPYSKQRVKWKVSILGNDTGFQEVYFLGMDGRDRNGGPPNPPWRLREWRRFKRLSQEQLAFKMGTGKPTISKLERYQLFGPGPGRQKLNDELRERYCKALDITTQQLLTLPDAPSQLEELLAQQRRTTAMIENFVKS